MRPPDRKLSDLFKFAKPKTPGYEISKDYYLSVLASKPTLPTPRQVLHPKGNQGAVPGMLAPLRATSKQDLEVPMTRGIYALASPDQKTVLKLMIMPRDEAGFDPEPFLRSAVAENFSPEVRTRVAATWHVMQLTFEAFDPTIGPALDFFLLSARRLAELTEGVIADPICRRYQLPSEVIQSPRLDAAFDAREHITVLRGKHGQSAHTAGLIKFGLPEFEVNDLDPQSHLAETFFLNLCQAILKGNVPGLGSQVGPFQVSVGGANRGDWEGIPVYELLPPTGTSAQEALVGWAGSRGD